MTSGSCFVIADLFPSLDVLIIGDFPEFDSFRVLSGTAARRGHQEEGPRQRTVQPAVRRLVLECPTGPGPFAPRVPVTAAVCCDGVLSLCAVCGVLWLCDM